VLRRRIGRGLVLAAVAGAVAAIPAAPASGHISFCHLRQTCPSDHASYRWRNPHTGSRLLCVKPTADERDSSFKIRVVWQGRTYWCKR
jgi:hypothetical protein